MEPFKIGDKVKLADSRDWNFFPSLFPNPPESFTVTKLPEKNMHNIEVIDLRTNMKQYFHPNMFKPFKG